MNLILIKQNLLIEFLLNFSGQFTIFADISETKNGYPRIVHEGHSFGRKRSKSNYFEVDTTWVCTGTRNKKRCLARLITKVINGFIMMRVRDSNHTCHNHQNRNHQI